MELNKIRQLDFSDLYLGHPLLGDRFTDSRGSAVSPVPMNRGLSEDLRQLKEICQMARRAAPRRPIFKIEYDGVAYRVSVVDAVHAEVFVLRKICGTLRSLAELGIPPVYARHMMRRDLTGLLVISGGVKAGKTMTASALIRERLIAYGGVAVTAENPIELPLEGGHGEGICYQTMPSRSGGDTSDALRSMLRWGAKIIFIDSLEDCRLTAEVLLATVKQHLLIATMNADNVTRTIAKLHALGTESLDHQTVQRLLASGLAGVLHQRLTTGEYQKLETEFFMLRDAANAQELIGQGRYRDLPAEIRQQMRAMINENAVAERIGGA